MPHIALPEGLAGMRSLLAYRPETGQIMCELADIAMRGPGSTLTPAERELIATYVSSLNDCFYCQTSHGAVAAEHLNGDRGLVDQVKLDFSQAAVSEKFKALLAIAAKVQRGGQHVTSEDVEKARQLGATDLEIHDTVFIAARFCMANRYVDGLATFAPQDPEAYRERAAQIAKEGYGATRPKTS